MAVVLVHGIPETAAVWGPLVAVLGRNDISCLSPPGFGVPVLDGWDATVEKYRDWLIGELEELRASATGGWCKIQRAAPTCSPVSGRRFPADRAAPE